MTDQSQLLMDYTVFHIGVYLALGGAALTLRELTETWQFSVAAFFFLIAGMSGGVIGSNLPDYKTFDEFKVAKIGPLGREWLEYKWWSYIEHDSFWVGLIFGIIVVQRRWRPASPQLQGRPNTE